MIKQIEDLEKKGVEKDSKIEKQIEVIAENKHELRSLK